MISFQRRKKLIQVENIKYRVGISRCSIPRWKCTGLWAPVRKPDPLCRSGRRQDKVVPVKNKKQPMITRLQGKILRQEKSTNYKTLVLSSCLIFPCGSVLQRDKVDIYVEVNLPPSSDLPTVEEGKQYFFFNLARPRVGRWYSIIFSLARPRDSSFTPSLVPRELPISSGPHHLQTGR